MLRTSILCSLFASVILPACATNSPEDELAGESPDDGDVGKGDTADAFTYYSVTVDARACSLNTVHCGGYFVERVGRSTTPCGATTESRCYVDALDWKSTGMPASVSASFETRIRNGEALILRGDVVAPIVHPPTAPRTTLAATEIWVAGSSRGSIDSGVFVLIKDNGLQCITAPCPTLGETRLNSNRSANIHQVDFDASGATADEIKLARAQLNDDGVIVVGERAYPDHLTRARVANQFYTRAPVPLHSVN